MQLLEHTFRHEYGRIVSTLVKHFGPGLLDDIEDAVQTAMMTAVRNWPKQGQPDNPGAWLTTVARNRLLDELKRNQREVTTDDDVNTQPIDEEALPPSTPVFNWEIDDDELRMLFICCDPELADSTQLVLGLKILLGFSSKEIALRLMLTEETVNKRLTRSKARLKTLWGSQPNWQRTPERAALLQRLPNVHQLLYLLFNEGYSAARDDQIQRKDLCDEAIRLCQLLAHHKAGDTPASWALLAIMLMHIARFNTRLDDEGNLQLLKDQDRSKWHQPTLQSAMACLQKTGVHKEFSRYQVEAAILAEHCFVPSYAATQWQNIVNYYEYLERLYPSPIYTLNKAIALAEWQGPEVALDILLALTPPSWLTRYYLWDATLGDLLLRCNRPEQAKPYLENALGNAPSKAEQGLIKKRLKFCIVPQ